MRLSKPLIAKFQQTHLEEFGEAISAETAEAELLELAELISITSCADSGGDDNEN